MLIRDTNPKNINHKSQKRAQFIIKKILRTSKGYYNNTILKKKKTLVSNYIKKKENTCT